MPLDRHAARFLAMFGAAGASQTYTGPGDRRRALEDLAKIADYDPCEVASIDSLYVPGGAGMLAARAYTPMGASPGLLPGLVFFHGGGWVAGDLNTHDGVCRRLANASGCKVIAVDYRRAPEHPFPPPSTTPGRCRSTSRLTRAPSASTRRGWVSPETPPARASLPPCARPPCAPAARGSRSSS